ncbi:hypothetical protein CEUSTIGMA_g3633.t1 [Chlamydomonas eustigma]|uniref:DNA helicase n=1 Tax=Chlamydomonas eustigma TaxID=1157962 RepID=A0A250WZS1_9CHLO|nr:hypothetical protein CEUSTIGMA_g3633.t1 [Chlamydomonas eustigma]|eukprot:GAX76189.1 hypothetical protein CEUSTIGMA_g3633.t1 [Chlamydomonas eustigma]
MKMMPQAVHLTLPTSVNSRQRAIIHAVAESSGLHHGSTGDGSERKISIGYQEGEKVDLSSSLEGQALSDDDICSLLLKYFKIDASKEFKKEDVKRTAKPAKASSTGFGSQALDLDKFIATTRELIEMEREAEVQQATEAAHMRSAETAQARGTTLLNLRCEDVEGVTAPLLPQHKFSPHDIVALRPSKGPADGPALVQGVVYRVKETALVVAVDDAPDEGLEQPLRLDKLANEVTYKRLKETLSALASSTTGSSLQPGGSLVEVMFGRKEPRFVDTPPAWQPFNHSLDDSQRRAISLALSAKDVALVHGPPGTGKTTAVVEIIWQEVARGSRVLACAASNIAVDNLVERLASVGGKAATVASVASNIPSNSSGAGSGVTGGTVRVVRLGHPARLLPQVLDNSLEAHVLRSDNSSLAKDCRKEIKSLNQKLKKLDPWKKAERRQLRDELRQLSKEERKRQGAAVAEVIRGAQVIASTLTGVLHHTLDSCDFDVCVIDEAAQALEASCWGALLKARRAVLAGDHLQLPPTILSEAAAARGLGRTLFERLQDMYGSLVSEMLTVQYRMNSNIMQWSSDALYQGKLTAHESVASHDLHGIRAEVSTSGSAKKKSNLPAAVAVPSAEVTLPVLLLVDTAGCGFEERQEEEGDSKCNEGEAKAVMAHVESLMKAGIPAFSIGVITPYNAQVALLKEMRPEKIASQLEISSVDGFQGREKEAIIISMVRSNDKREVGFLADQRRMNVAITRARRQCTLVCDSETITSSGNVFLKRLIDYFEQHGEYISASELVS